MLGVIMALAWPTIVEQVMQTAVQYIDTAMVGSLGTQATAAVGATSTFGWMVFSTISALSVGFLSFIAQACGANDREAAKKAVSQAVLITLVGGILVTFVTTSLSGIVPKLMQVDPDIQELASTYFFILYLPMLPRTASTIFGTLLRAAGDTKTPMKVGILVNIINIVGNLLLIFPSREIVLGSLAFTLPGAGLGVVGAAIASALAFTWGGIHITYALWKHPMVSPRGCNLRPDMTILKPCIKIAIPNMFQRFGTSLGFVAFASMINSIGEVATAAHTIANTVESAFYIPGYGMQTAASTLAGNAYGARDNERLKKLAAMFIPVEIILMIVSGGALFVAAPSLMKIFSSNPEVIELGATVLRMVAVSEPFYGFSIIIEGMMLGLGKTKEPFVYNVLGMWCVRIIGTFICTQLLGMGLVSAWACMIGHNLLIFALYMVSYIRGTWNPMNRELSAVK
ncbi:MAG: MATE family efflux transporter [Ruminococcaceae bacterium]|nr:MATE family efflux transporter [Oscillospiraceae bacterium]